MNKIGIIDADLLDNGTKHPNLALMKISGYYKSLGNEVTLLEDCQDINKYDKVYISKVFNFTKTPLDLDKYDNIEIGGTGFFEDGGKNLPYEIEHHMPDYNLYMDYINKKIENGINRNYFKDYLDYSIGFTTRGCFRKCSFCVNKKYDEAIKHSPVLEFLDKNRKGIYLWDDNFLAFAEWETILDELIATQKPFQFRQGLDMRLINEKKAKKLSQVKYNGDFIFAFDHVEDKYLISKKLEIWKKYCKKTTKLYVLCAFDSQDEKDIESIFIRVEILMKYGCIPYLMRYEKYKDSKFEKIYITLARWINQPQFYKKMSFREFCERNQYYCKTSNICTSLKCMKEFENEFPTIAKKYFDLKYETICIYKKEKKK